MMLLRIPTNALNLWIGRFLVVLCTTCGSLVPFSNAGELQVGFAAIDITPDLKSPVFLAGYGWNRTATGVHDPIYARTVVLQDQGTKIAFVSVDLIGLQFPFVQAIRKQLKDFAYVMVSSTHSHEGPDTIGIWGKSPFHRGRNDDYMKFLKKKIVACIRKASESFQSVESFYGVASDESLLKDSRLPVVKDGKLRLLRFVNPSGKNVGLLVQWNCHPEALGPNNRQLTADFPFATIAELKRQYDCPIVYFTGAVGGLMAPPNDFKDDQGKLLREGEFRFAELYGQAVARLAKKAVADSMPIKLVPFRTSVKQLAIPVDNPYYRTAKLLGIVSRDSVAWTGDYNKTDAPIRLTENKSTFAIVSEIGYLRLGELSVACIPGEIYPELVYGKFQTPADPNADFADAPLEPHVTKILPDKKWLLFGLANDEIGYIIPKRQWDRIPPYAYGRKSSQYGEVNSCGPLVAPIISQALYDCVSDVLKP